MDFEELIDKNISLIIWNTEKEDDVHVYLRKLHFDNSEYYFENREKGWRVSLDKEQVKQLKPVSDDLIEMLLNADYALSLSMGNLPEDNTDFEATGIKWHK